MAKKWIGPVPFLIANGNLVSQNDRWLEKDTRVKWVPNYEFTDELTYEHREAEHYYGFKRSDGSKVTFLTERFAELIPHMVRGKIAGTFTFTKKGADNFSCRLLRV